MEKVRNSEFFFNENDNFKDDKDLVEVRKENEEVKTKSGEQFEEYD